MAVIVPGSDGGSHRLSARPATSASSGLKLESMKPASGVTFWSASVSGQDADDSTDSPAAAAAACSAPGPVSRPGPPPGPEPAPGPGMVREVGWVMAGQ